MERIEYKGVIRNGILTIYEKDNLGVDIKNSPDCEVVLTITQKKPFISRVTMNYYRKVIIQAYIKGMLEKWGEIVNKDEAHSQLKEHFNVEHVSKLTNYEADEYFDKCRFLIEDYLGIKVDDPKSM